MAKKIPLLISNLIMALLFVAVAAYLDTPRERKPIGSNCNLFERSDPEETAEQYAQEVTSDFRDIRSRRVTLLPLAQRTEPAMVLNNVCEQRWYLAKLIDQVGSSGATAIVLDKLFDPESCDKDDARTGDLLHSVQASPLPIFVAAATHSPATDPKHSCLIVSDSLDFGKKLDKQGAPTERAAMIKGLARLNADIKRIPLNWFIYPDEKSFANHEEPKDDYLQTLSFAVASFFDHGLKDEPGMSELLQSNVHPFTSFIEPDKMSHVSPQTFLCASSDRSEIESRYGHRCPDPPPEPIRLDGQVAVIGQDSPDRDQHDLFGRQVPGVYLHANYIESLLDGRYLKPFGGKRNLWAFIGLLIVLTLLFWIQPELALMIGIVLAYGIHWGIHYLVMSRGIYPDRWVVHLGVAALVFKYIESRGHTLMHKVMEGRKHATRSDARQPNSSGTQGGTPGAREP